MEKRIGDILVDRGLLSPEELDQALREHATSGLQLGSYLLRRNLVTRENLGKAFSEQFEVPLFSISVGSIHPQLPKLLPETFVRSRGVVPVNLKGRKLHLAMVWPGDIEAISEVELMTGYEVTTGICLAEEFSKLIEVAFDRTVQARQMAIDIRYEELASAQAAGMHRHSEVNETESPVVRLANSILIGAVRAGASDIHLEPHDPQMRVRYRIDGEMHQMMTIPADVKML